MKFLHLRAGLGVLRLVGRAHAGGQHGVLGGQAPRGGAALLQFTLLWLRENFKYPNLLQRQ